MKKIQYIFLIFALTAWVACEKENETAVAAEDDCAYLSAGFGAVTYATAADENEKTLASVAFFIETANGDFFRYFSHQPAGSAEGFLSFKTDSDGNYTGVGLKIDGTNTNGKGRVAVVGNYAENGLTAVLEAVSSMTALQQVQCNNVAETGIATPLLLFHDITELNLYRGKTEEKSFAMKRLAARIDVKVEFRKAADDSVYDPTKIGYFDGNFQFNVFSLKSSSHILPVAPEESDKVTAIEEYGTFFPVIERRSDGVYFSFYTYETSGLESSPLCIYIRYIIAGEAYKSDIFTVCNSEGKPKIERNNCYHLPITITGRW